MTWHPLTLAIGVVELTCWTIYIGAAWRLLAVIPHWTPEYYDARQLWRQRALEMTAFQGQWTLALQAVAFLLLLAGLTNIWVPAINGAICGAGVLEALGSDGYQTLVFRGAALLILYCWLAMLRLVRHHPEKGAAILPARMLLLAGPFMALGSWTLFRAIVSVNRQTAVNCCVVVYNQALAPAAAGNAPAALLPPLTWVILAAAGALVLAGGGIVRWRRPERSSTFQAAALTVGALLWAVAAFKALALGTAPAVARYSTNPCGWCLFLVKHGAPGVILFGLPLAVLAEAMASLPVWVMGRRLGIAPHHLIRRMGRSGRVILGGSTLFALALLIPLAVRT